MRRPQGVFNYGGGHKNLFQEKKLANLGKESIGRFVSILDSHLARRPGGAAERSAHSAGPRSFSKQCCLKVASVRLLARWRSHRFFFSRVGTFGCRFWCLLGAFGDPRAALGVAWASFGGPLGAFFGVFGAPFGSPGSSREPLSVPGELFGRSWAAVWPPGSLWGRPLGKSGKL